MARVEIGVPDRQEGREATLGRSGQHIGEHVEAALVRPLHVIDDQHGDQRGNGTHERGLTNSGFALEQDYRCSACGGLPYDTEQAFEYLGAPGKVLRWWSGPGAHLAIVAPQAHARLVPI